MVVLGFSLTFAANSKDKSSMKQLTAIILLIASVLFTACQKDYEHKTVLCIPVYGQSLALGEEAECITESGGGCHQE